jgi:hypothetical protein
MPRLFKRWYVWLGLVLLLGLAGSVALICSSQSRINQANLDRIQLGMSRGEVEDILGQTEVWTVYDLREKKTAVEFFPMRPAPDTGHWYNGPSYIFVQFEDSKAVLKLGRIATAWQTLQWYAKKGAGKIGVNWD